MSETNLKTINEQKVVPEKKEVISNPIYEKYGPDHVMNVIENIKAINKPERIWFDFSLPSNGRCGYPKIIQLRELTTEDEKIFLKEIFGGKEKAVMNLIKKCAKFEDGIVFDFNSLTTFDQDFILLELSSITFPGEKSISITDENGHKVEMKLNKEELTMNKMEENEEYPFKVELDNGYIWYLEFMTLDKIAKIENTSKMIAEGDYLTRVFNSISHCTNKVVIKENNLTIKVDTIYDYVRLLESMKLRHQEKIIKFYNDSTSLKYGYKLTKEYFCVECGKYGKVALDPTTFFRLTM